MRVLVTGANGFVGQKLTASLLKQGHSVVAGLRQQYEMPEEIISFVYGDISATTDFQLVLADIDIVIHLAARVHVMKERAEDPLEQFREVNTQGTLNLAEQAAEAGVKQFIFLSTIGVNGNKTIVGQPYTEEDTPNPHNDYARSKWEAELGLRDISERYDMGVTVIRAPLIYGVGAPGNFSKLLKWIETGIPLPLAGIKNRRSLLSVCNLVDFVNFILNKRLGKYSLFLLADNVPLSTTGLLRNVAKSIGRPIRLFFIPKSIFNAVTGILGKKPMTEQLLGTLEVSNERAQRLGWSPKFDIKSTLKRESGKNELF